MGSGYLEFHLLSCRGYLYFFLKTLGIGLWIGYISVESIVIDPEYGFLLANVGIRCRHSNDSLDMDLLDHRLPSFRYHPDGLRYLPIHHDCRRCGDFDIAKDLSSLDEITNLTIYLPLEQNYAKETKKDI